MTEFLRRWGPALLWTGLLFVVSSQSRLPVELHTGTDKLAHFAAYTVLGALLALGQARSGIPVLLVLVAGSLIGALDELYQSTVPGRSAELLDWVADSLGIVTGVLSYHVWRRGCEVRAPQRPGSEPLPHE